MRGAQLVPPSVVFHTPPEAEPMYTVLGTAGSTAIETTRPPALAFPLQYSLLMGRGPIGVQTPGPSVGGLLISSGVQPGTGSAVIRQ